MLRPLCPPGSTLCASYPYTTATNVTVAKPSTPLLPTPVLSYSSVISSCGSLTVDASSSTGSGGRYDNEQQEPFPYNISPLSLYRLWYKGLDISSFR
jgi:hypothetical protein